MGTSVETSNFAVQPTDRRGRLGSDRAAVTTSVSVRLLGPFGVARSGVAQAVPPSRKVRALLAYLILAPRPVQRSALCELLWDVPDDPRGELRWCLSKIRKLIDEPGHARVRADREFVSIDRAEISVDACGVANTVEAGLARAGPDILQDLAGRFAGEFLEGLTLDRSPVFETWLVSQRHVFRALHAQVLVRLAALSSSDPERGLAYLRQRLDLQRYDETAHSDLLAALARCGRIEEGEAHVAAAGRLFNSEGLSRAPLDRAWAQAKRAATGACATRIAAEVERAIDARVGASGGRRASIAVMPFLALSGPDGNLADGLSHDIISGLARLRNLFVIARAAAHSPCVIRPRTRKRLDRRSTSTTRQAARSCATAIGSLSQLTCALPTTAVSSGQMRTRRRLPTPSPSWAASRPGSSARSTPRLRLRNAIARFSSRPIRSTPGRRIISGCGTCTGSLDSTTRRRKGASSAP